MTVLYFIIIYEITHHCVICLHLNVVKFLKTLINANTATKKYLGFLYKNIFQQTFKRKITKRNRRVLRRREFVAPVDSRPLRRALATTWRYAD